MAKQYGLIKSDKNKVITRPAIFNSDSDSDEPEKPTGISTLKKKERLAQENLVAEDPTIYQYDELYDDMTSKRKESKLARKDLERKPKYINKLLESAERRKRENERRIERDVQKERELEGDMFKDKEAFVTSAYKKKLEELKELEEKEKREDYLEAIGDVKKQQDLSGFYRHLYAQQVNYDDNEKSPKTKENDTNEPTTSDKTPSKDETIAAKMEQKQNAIKKRKYRKREDSKSDENSPEEAKTKLEHLPSNIDADSDFSIDSGSDESDSEPETKKNRPETVKTNETDTNEPPKQTNEEDSVVKIKEEEKPPEIKVEVPKKPKINIWKKRTIGPVFDDALKRYYERKAAKILTVS